MQIIYTTEIMALYEIYKTKYDAMVITGREKSLKIGLVLADNTHHETIRKIGHTIQSIPEECNAACIVWIYPVIVFTRIKELTISLMFYS